MSAKKFSDAMSELDTKYADEALKLKKKAKKTGWIKWGAVAACLIMIVGIVFWSPQLMTAGVSSANIYEFVWQLCCPLSGRRAFTSAVEMKPAKNMRGKM